MNPVARMFTTVVCLAAGLPLTGAYAGKSSVSLEPVCVTKSGAALFFLEVTEDCSAANRHCRGSRWAWAALKGNAWEFEPQGEAMLDDTASPEANAQAARQLFKPPAAQTCVSFLRAPRVREPDLADSDAFFQYTVERGVLVLHWGDSKATVAADVHLSRAAWKDGPKAEAKSIDPGFTLQETRAGKKAVAQVVPAVELSVGGEVLVGFPEPAQDGPDTGFLLLQIPEAKLRALQAQLLHEDGKKVLEKGPDLLGDARAAGLLDAALQLSPSSAEVRMDFARILGRLGDAAATVRELEKLKGAKDLRSRIESDKAFVPVKSKEPFKKFVDGLPK